MTQMAANGLKLILQIFLIFTLVSTILARPLADNQLLQQVISDSVDFEGQQPLVFSKFADSEPIFYRAGIKRHIQAFSDQSSNVGKLNARNMLRAMINFRRY